MSRLRRKNHRGPAPEDIYLSGVMKPNGSVVSHEVFKLIYEHLYIALAVVYIPHSSHNTSFVYPIIDFTSIFLLRMDTLPIVCPMDSNRTYVLYLLSLQ